MNQKLYDSKAQTLIDFVPVTDGHVSMYVCGPTVQSAPHVGHLRSALVYDQLRRWFETCGLRVTLIRNVTDIDDKILVNAQASESGDRPETWWALAQRVEREFDAAYSQLGITAPTAAPRATGFIANMVALIERLIERGHAYQADDGSANVYFDAASWKQYGELTHQNLDNLEEGAEDAAPGKRNRQDFALWKASRDSEPELASWPSPWGPGRPGWHIECSAMATHFLGSTFDIHGGGRDLRFPHHENELAQSAAAGDGFARVWLHNGLVNTGGQKMSKSLGNSLFAHDLLSSHDPLAVRYFLGSAHYRSQLDYSPASLDEAAAAVDRIRGALERAARELGDEMPDTPESLTELTGVYSALPEKFTAAMFDDLSVPLALAEIHGAVRRMNTAFDAQELDTARSEVTALVAMLAVLHLDPRHPQWAGAAQSQGGAAGAALDSLVQGLIAQRAQARKDKDFATADAVRDVLTQAGIVLEDSATETHWSLL